jgi:hypothetical protein
MALHSMAGPGPADKVKGGRDEHVVGPGYL